MPSKYRKSTKPRVKPTGRKAAPAGTYADLNLATLAATFADDDKARTFLEGIRWPNGPVCPHCGSKEVTRLEGKATRPGVHKCKAKACRKQFTFSVGTIFEKSHIPLRQWVLAFHLMVSSKKGISAHQLHRMLDITYKSAWFMCHRIRHAMTQGLDAPMTGVIEADETYVGGKPRPQAGVPRTSTRGRGTLKTPVLVLVQRDGAAVCRPLPNVTTKELRNHAHLIASEATLVTDEWKSYGPIGKRFAAHLRVNHGEGEYARQEGELSVNTNTAESFFSLLKRGHYGTFHKISKHHLYRYCHEFEFRWSRRKMTDGERLVRAIRGAEGKRLMYRESSRLGA